MKHKVNQLRLLIMLLAIAFTAFNCDEQPTDSNGEEITWQQTALDSLGITSLAANSTGGVFAASCGYDLYRTTDGGDTWVSLSRACPVFLAINADDELFYVADSGFSRSSDNGESWGPYTLILGFGVDLRSIAFNEAGEIFVGSSPSDESIGGVYHSVDNGDTWTQTSFPDSIAGREPAINANGDIFVGTGSGVFRSTDNGETSVQINNGFADLGLPTYVLSLAISPVNGDIFVAMNFDGVYRSTDDGDTWVHTGLRSLIIESLVINSNGDIFAGSGRSNTSLEPEGVFYSNDDGNSWRQINDGLANINVSSLAVDASGFVYAGTGGDGVFRTVKSTTE